MKDLSLSGALFLLLTTSYTATIRVPQDQSIIQAAIKSAVNGDTLLINPGNYAGDSNCDVSVTGKAILGQIEDTHNVVARTLVQSA